MQTWLAHDLIYLGDLAHKRHIEPLKNGRKQKVRIPREFDPGEETMMQEEAERSIIEPASSKCLLMVLARLETLDEDFLPIPDPPLNPVNI